MRSVLMRVALVLMSLACDSLSGDKPPVAPQERVTISTRNELLPGIPSKVRAELAAQEGVDVSALDQLLAKAPEESRMALVSVMSMSKGWGGRRNGPGRSEAASRRWKPDGRGQDPGQ
jgi:hypothetical protein